MAILINLMHLHFKTIPVYVIKKSPPKPSNIKKISWPYGKRDLPDKKNYIPVPDVSRLSIE